MKPLVFRNSRLRPDLWRMRCGQNEASIAAASYRVTKKLSTGYSGISDRSKDFDLKVSAYLHPFHPQFVVKPS